MNMPIPNPRKRRSKRVGPRVQPTCERKESAKYYTANCLVLFGAVFADVPEFTQKAANFCFGAMRAAREMDAVGR